MIYVMLVFSAFLCACSITLLVRLCAITAAVRKEGGADAVDDVFLAAFTTALDTAVDAGLLLLAGPKGLEDIDLRFREHQDPYRTTGELVHGIVQGRKAAESVAVVGLIKSVYQFQYTFDLPVVVVEPSLRELVNRLTSGPFSGKPVGRVEMVSAGVLLSSRIMMPLTNGTHVKQPLGVIIFDQEGKVLNKAKVLCS